MSGRRSDEAAILAEKNGFEDVYSLSGGMKEWDGPIQPFLNNHSPWVHTIFDTETETAQYIVTDLGNAFVCNEEKKFMINCNKHTIIFKQ